MIIKIIIQKTLRYKILENLIKEEESNFHFEEGKRYTITCQSKKQFFISESLKIPKLNNALTFINSGFYYLVERNAKTKLWIKATDKTTVNIFKDF